MNKLVKQLKLSTAREWPHQAKDLLTIAWKWQKDLVITITEDKETRRDKQNRLMWVWHAELSAHILESTGQTFGTEDIHEWIAEKLLPKGVVNLNNEPIIVRTRTSKLSVKEFAAFLTHYEVFANETYNCRFTQPDDLYMDAIMK